MPSEKFSAFAAGVASGTDKSIWNLFNSAATPTSRPAIAEIIIGSVATPADQAAKFTAGRTTAVGTEGAGFTPVNIDPGGPAGQCDLGVGVFSAEPTYTSNKELLCVSLNQRATFRWIANPGFELLLTATQNNGVGLKSKSATSTQAHESTVLFQE